MSEINKLNELLMEAQQLAGKLGFPTLVQKIGKLIMEIPVDIPGIQQDFFKVADDLLQHPEIEVHQKTTNDLERHKVHDLKTMPKPEQDIGEKPVKDLPEPTKKGGMFKK